MTFATIFNFFTVICAIAVYITCIILRLGFKKLIAFEAFLMILSVFYVPVGFWLCGENPLGFIVLAVSLFSAGTQIFFPARRYQASPKHPTALIKELKYSSYMLIAGSAMSVFEIIWFFSADTAASLVFGNGLMLFVMPTLLPAILINKIMPLTEAHLNGIFSAIILSQIYITASCLKPVPYLAEKKSTRVLLGILSFIPFANFVVSLIIQIKLRKQCNTH